MSKKILCPEWSRLRIGAPCLQQLTEAGQRPSIEITTNRNNFNRHRIFSFRAKLQTPQSVSTPSCATMKQTEGSFRKGNPKPLKFSGFKICNSFPFNQAPKKHR